MGNCCSLCWEIEMAILTYDNGKVCGRCHRPGHSRKDCFADTYSDGSIIRKVCRKCGMFHSGDIYNKCAG